MATSIYGLLLEPLFQDGSDFTSLTGTLPLSLGVNGIGSFIWACSVFIKGSIHWDDLDSIRFIGSTALLLALEIGPSSRGGELN